MKIQYLGHSSFKLTESTGISVVTDPYDDSVGYHMPETDADAVTVSHHHYDHDAISKVKGNPVVLDKETGYILKDSVEISSIMSFHDDCRGKKRGENIIFKFRMDGLDVCHLGDLGEDCSSDLIEMILPVNVLMIPVGGNYTIDAKMAKEYVDRIMPDIVIPMHYRAKGCKLDIDKVDDFIDEFDGENVVIAETGDEIEISRDDLDGEQTTIIVMENGQ
ncbi:MAG TPA: MBL fold metallo-hydrolase [Candidatus Coproplasma avicola]|uniref:MBL fold metallo-hydrolase n=1 Tax=Candidatus Coproplasma avicola TaxID=2840744 RepID=A0A9D1E598_9FIRM|nr:MBL fold metallo-hydrolase [Candidatus Coproplasma avicola]